MITGAPGEIRTPDPQIRSLVLYPAELRARRVLAIGFGAYWQAPAAAAGQQGLRRTGAVGAGIAARMTCRRRKIFPGLGLGVKALAKSVDKKADDNKETDPADNSRCKHREWFLAVFLSNFSQPWARAPRCALSSTARSGMVSRNVAPMVPSTRRISPP
jgi:hypothetical protein